jgi:hypothetical protein
MPGFVKLTSFVLVAISISTSLADPIPASVANSTYGDIPILARQEQVPHYPGSPFIPASSAQAPFASGYKSIEDNIDELLAAEEAAFQALDAAAASSFVNGDVPNALAAHPAAAASVTPLPSVQEKRQVKSPLPAADASILAQAEKDPQASSIIASASIRLEKALQSCGVTSIPSNLNIPMPTAVHSLTPEEITSVRNAFDSALGTGCEFTTLIPRAASAGGGQKKRQVKSPLPAADASILAQVEKDPQASSIIASASSRLEKALQSCGVTSIPSNLNIPIPTAVHSLTPEEIISARNAFDSALGTGCGFTTLIPKLTGV